MEQKISDQQILDALAKAEGNRTAAARILGVVPATIYARIRKLPPAMRPPAVRGTSGRKPSIDQAVEKLWEQYAANHQNQELRNRLVEYYLPIADRCAMGVARTLPKNVESGDLVSAAQMALLRIVELFEPERGLRFATYATPRLRGAILDELREMDLMPRLTRRRVRQRAQIEDQLAQKLGHAPTAEEMAEAGAGPEEKFPAVCSLETEVHQADGDRLVIRELLASRSIHDPRMAFLEITRGLNMDESTAVYLYYCKGHTMVFVGEALCLGESRVSQILKEVVARLKSGNRDKIIEVLRKSS